MSDIPKNMTPFGRGGKQSGEFRLPFCLGKREREGHLQSSSVGQGSPNPSIPVSDEQKRARVVSGQPAKSIKWCRRRW